jgi:hypothetical protein
MAIPAASSDAKAGSMTPSARNPLSVTRSTRAPSTGLTISPMRRAAPSPAMMDFVLLKMKAAMRCSCTPEQFRQEV